jgi:hypothetical protein
LNSCAPSELQILLPAGDLLFSRFAFPVLQDLQAAYAAKVFKFNGKKPELYVSGKAAEPWNADLGELLNGKMQ